MVSSHTYLKYGEKNVVEPILRMDFSIKWYGRNGNCVWTFRLNGMGEAIKTVWTNGSIKWFLMVFVTSSFLQYMEINIKKEGRGEPINCNFGQKSKSAYPINCRNFRYLVFRGNKGEHGNFLQKIELFQILKSLFEGGTSVEEKKIDQKGVNHSIGNATPTLGAGSPCPPCSYIYDSIKNIRGTAGDREGEFLIHERNKMLKSLEIFRENCCQKTKNRPLVAGCYYFAIKDSDLIVYTHLTFGCWHPNEFLAWIHAHDILLRDSLLQHTVIQIEHHPFFDGWLPLSTRFLYREMPYDNKTILRYDHFIQQYREAVCKNNLG